MKNTKKLSILLLVLSATYVRPESESMADRIKFAQETNANFSYDKKVDRKPLNGQDVEEYIDIKISKHSYDSGITRTKTQVKVDGNEIVTTVETWITITAARIALTGAAILGGAILGNKIGSELGDRYYSSYQPSGKPTAAQTAAAVTAVAGATAGIGYLGYQAYQNPDEFKEQAKNFSDNVLTPTMRTVGESILHPVQAANNMYNAVQSRFGSQSAVEQEMNDTSSDVSSDSGAAMDNADAASL